ncbi:MAG: NADH:ubiquinone reductase (Na(+)-transporting) subunit B [Bacteroidales bacterium]|nr:NADH:ubiquinone reductase (Na(+)-transporting) subunit B [Bacteroidales bacterium]
MKGLRKLLDSAKPNFEKGAKFGKLHSLFDALETLAFVPNRVTKSGAHIRDAIDMKRTMIVVVLAMVPALLFGMWNVGHFHFQALGQLDQKTFWEIFWFGFLKVLPIILVSYVTGLTIEIIFAQIRNHDVPEGFFVTGFLIPLIMPVDVPLWMVAIATAFAVIIGVEVFGGAGMNILNPALTARAFLFFSYPSWMSGDKVWVSGLSEMDKVADGFTGETIMGMYAQAPAGVTPSIPYSPLEMFLGTIPGSIGETSTLAILIGAAILIWTGIGSWKIIVSVFGGGLLMGYILNLFAVNPYMQVDAWEHLLLGGFAFGAVFMATDPVSATQTERGKWIYGFLIGLLAILIRVLNPAYPEGVMLAILLMNVFAPLIDHYVVEANIKKRKKRLQASNS